MTMHRVKGREFAKFILLGVSDSSLPQKHAIQGLAEREREMRCSGSGRGSTWLRPALGTSSW